MLLACLQLTATQAPALSPGRSGAAHSAAFVVETDGSVMARQGTSKCQKSAQACRHQSGSNQVVRPERQLCVCSLPSKHPAVSQRRLQCSAQQLVLLSYCPASSGFGSSAALAEPPHC